MFPGAFEGTLRSRITSQPSRSLPRSDRVLLNSPVPASEDTEFEWDRETPSDIPYHLQGDLSLNSPKTLARRQSLGRHPVVKRAISEWWSIFQKNEHGLVGKEEYLKVHRLVTKVLVPGLSEQEIEKSGNDDWKRDSATCSSTGMDVNAVSVSVFEMADLWCQGVDAEEYANFLRKVLKRITKPSEKKRRQHSRGASVVSFEEQDKPEKPTRHSTSKLPNGPLPKLRMSLRLSSIFDRDKQGSDNRVVTNGTGHGIGESTPSESDSECESADESMLRRSSTTPGADSSRGPSPSSSSGRTGKVSEFSAVMRNYGNNGARTLTKLQSWKDVLSDVQPMDLMDGLPFAPLQNERLSQEFVSEHEDRILQWKVEHQLSLALGGEEKNLGSQDLVGIGQSESSA